MKTIALFHHKSDVGKTSLVYHLTWMYEQMGVSVLAADLDPQSDLTRMFVDDDRMELLWPEESHTKTVFGALQPLREGIGDVSMPFIERITYKSGLLVGDITLATIEDELTAQWSAVLERQLGAVHALLAFRRVIEHAAQEWEAELVLIDVGSNLGPITRTALLAADYVIVPIAPDRYSLRALHDLGPALRRWREAWSECRVRNVIAGLSLPFEQMIPAGYIVMPHAVRFDRPLQPYEHWLGHIPMAYRTAVLGENAPHDVPPLKSDPHCLALLKPYHSLMSMAQEARKPMFMLKAADGALSGHARAAQDCYRDFHALATAIAERCGVDLP